MITNSNESKAPFEGEIVDYKKYVGVASVNVLAINPNNAKLRSLGWNIPEDAKEPEYVITKEKDGKLVKSARVRFLVQIQDLEDKPIIPLDFWIRPDVAISSDKTKGMIIDAYGRTAWGTQEEVKAKEIPMYTSGKANISADYKLCHWGQDDLVRFLLKYLNVTPLQKFDKNTNGYINTTNPGKLTIDRWEQLCAGNTSELVEYVSLQPKNCVKVILGVRTTEDNKSYQTFMTSRFIGNSVSPDRTTGEYASARKEIDKFIEDAQRRNSITALNTTFSASPVKEWSVTATDVQEAAVESSGMFDDNGDFTAPVDDLPFD